MLYRVKAKPKSEMLGSFYRALADGTISGQKPDGEEIVASMKRAVSTGPGIIEWYETCYCNPPLAHERQTVFNRYLDGIETVTVNESEPIEGDSFWEMLEREYSTR